MASQKAEVPKSGFEYSMIGASLQKHGGYAGLQQTHAEELGRYITYDFGDYADYDAWAAAWTDDPSIPMPTAAFSKDPLERFLAQNPRVTSGIVLPQMNTDRLQQLLSLMVVNPMGYKPGEKGTYSWGELAYIYQTTPSSDLARQLQSWRAEGQNLKADLMESYYGATKRPGESIDVIRRLMSKYGHGQTDVAMNPELVGQMLSRRATERRRPQYKGGTVTTGLLTSPALGFKRTLGG